MRAVGAGRPRTLLLVALVLAAAACDMEGPASIADVGELKVSDEPVLGHPYMLQYSIACDYELELMDAGTIIEWTPMPGEELLAEHAWHPWWVEGSDGEDVLVARYNSSGTRRLEVEQFDHGNARFCDADHGIGNLQKQMESAGSLVSQVQVEEVRTRRAFRT